MQPNELQSYVRFMREHLFDLIDIPKGNWHVPDGTLPVEQVNDFCTWYEEQIAEAGGIDIKSWVSGERVTSASMSQAQARKGRTRLITLDRVTRIDAASDFFGQEHVPRRAITMGVGSILAARADRHALDPEIFSFFKHCVPKVGRIFREKEKLRSRLRRCSRFARWKRTFLSISTSTI